MKELQKDLVQYRIARAKETLEEAQILAEREKWNATINRLYYSAYYAVMAILLHSGLKPTTHNGAKSNFTEHFIKTNIISKELGKIYSQLFTLRHKGDYDDFFNFQKDQVIPYFATVKELINVIEKIVK